MKANIRLQILPAVMMATGVATLSVSADEQEWNDGKLTVLQGNVVNLSRNNATNYYTGTGSGVAVTLHGDMNVTAPNYWVYVQNESGEVVANKYPYFDLGGAGGDTGRLVLNGCALSSETDSGYRMQLRDFATRVHDEPAVTLANGASMGMSAFIVNKAARSDSTCLTALDFGENCSAIVTWFENDSPVDMKIRFSGAGSHISAWSYGGVLFDATTVTGGNIILEGSRDAPIEIRSWPQGNKVQKLLEDASLHDLVFQGDCDVRLVSERDRTSINVNHSRIRFRQSGDLVFLGAVNGGCTSLVSVVDGLPSGSGVGLVRVQSNAGKPVHTLDLCGCSQKANGLVLEGGSRLLSTGGEAVLTFGEGDVDGVLGGVMDDVALSFVKVGTGDLLVTNATLSSLVVSNGTVTVDTGVLMCGTLQTVGPARIVCVNGGKVVATAGTACWELPATVATDLTAVDLSDFQVGTPSLSYGGDHLLTVLGANAFGAVNVRSGVLRVGGNRVSDLYWRMTFTGAAAGMLSAKWDGSEETTSRLVSLALGRFHLFSSAGAIASVASGDAGHFAANVTPADAKISIPNQVATTFVPDTTRLGWGLSTAANCVGFTTEELSAEAPIIITVKAKEAVWGYGMSQAGACPVGAPAAWRIESSANGETGWTLRDQRANQVEKSVNGGYNAYGNDGRPYPLSGGAQNSFFADGPVEVAAGATLDLSEIGVERISFGRLRIDASSGAGGTITRFVPAVEGCVDFDNVPIELLTENGALKGKLACLTVGEVVHGDRLSAWSVTINGRPSDARLRIANGMLYAVPNNGLMLICR